MKTLQCSNQSIESIFNDCDNALHYLGFSNITYDHSNYLMRAETGVSLRSFGEVVTIKVLQVGSQKVNIQISSELKMGFVGFGKNSNNEEKIANYLIALKQ